MYHNQPIYIDSRLEIQLEDIQCATKRRASISQACFSSQEDFKNGREIVPFDKERIRNKELGLLLRLSIYLGSSNVTRLDAMYIDTLPQITKFMIETNILGADICSLRNYPAIVYDNGVKIVGLELRPRTG